MRNIFFLALALSIIAAPTLPQTPDAKTIIAASRLATQSDSTIHNIVMTIINKRGEQQVQKIVTRSKTRNGLTSTVTTFLAPDETKGTKFLSIENKDRADDMKIFIPDLKKVRTISTSQREQSYMGTDFAFGDLENLSPNEGQHKLLGNETKNGQNCWKIETTLDPKQGAGYSKQINWFRADNNVPIKTEFYDKDGVLKKVKTVPILEKDGKIWVMKMMIMKDVQKDHQTIIEIVKFEHKPVEDTYFTEQFLQQTDKF